MAPNSLLAGTWDTHLHLLDPERFPFKADRKYTPSPALVSDLLARTQASNFLVVQATVEDGRTGILTLLRELQEQLPSPHKCFVAIAYDPDEHLTNDDLLRLHMAGVRGFRYHITFAGQDVEETVGVVRRLLHSDQAVFARKLAEMLTESDTSDLTIIAEHMGHIRLPFTGEAEKHFRAFLNLVRRFKLFVKVGALHRRFQPGAMSDLRAAIRAIADAAPEQLLWGSDWPHVDTQAGIDPAPPLPVDERAELETILKCVHTAVFEDMLVANPNRCFAVEPAGHCALSRQQSVE